jgi:hypothetical protein
MSLPGVLVLLVVLAAVERLMMFAGRASWLPWRRKARGMPVSATAFEEVALAFNGGKLIERDERQSRSMLRDEEAQGAPPRSRVDLDAGTATLHLPED